MTLSEYNRRQKNAAARLEKIGELKNARLWLCTNGTDLDSEATDMTPLEFAELEMPIGAAGWLLRALGLF